MNIVDKKYMIYLRNNEYLVCEESYKHYIDEKEIVRTGFFTINDAKIEAINLQSLQFETK